MQNGKAITWARRLLDGEEGAMRIDRAFQGTLLSTGGFAAVALFNTPFTVVLGKVLVILTTVACIAGIAMIAKKKGLIEASLTEAPKSGV